MCIIQGVKSDKTLLKLFLRGWANEFDELFYWKCEPGEVLKTLESEHSNWYEDRRWKFTCVKPKFKLDKCDWVDGELQTQFIHRGGFGRRVLAGLGGYHRERTNDRRYEYYFCKTEASLKNCKLTDWLNKYDEKVDYTVPDDKVITEVWSEFKDWNKDRRFKLKICDV